MLAQAKTTTPVTIGRPPWTRDNLLALLEPFAELYARRPIADNQGGMKSPHLFAVWSVLRHLCPKAVVESGVWHGQGTWLIEQACPHAELHAIDPNLRQIRYRSPRATYHQKDFADLDWSALPASDTVLLFDDHQNAMQRVRLARQLGFRHLLFEDNYPASRGDCCSLKKIWMGCPDPAGSDESPDSDLDSSDPAAWLRQVLDVYHEFPPVYRLDRTRWGDAWDDEAYPTPEPLLPRVTAPWQQVYRDEADSYTWLCYARLTDAVNPPA